MKKEKQWRFKTKAELEKEFGYVGNVSCGWASEMNNLFGVPYKGIMPTEKTLGGLGIWVISLDMLTTKSLPKLLADGTIAKVNMKVLWDENGTGKFKYPAAINTMFSLKNLTDKEDLSRIQIRCYCQACKEHCSKGYSYQTVLLFTLIKFPKQPKALVVEAE